MKQDIVVIRESIGHIVSMLTNQSIKVTQRGSRAYVKYHPKNGSILEMNIPYIPDDASDEFIAAIQGFLDHEVGHVLYSDYKALKAAASAGKRVANTANLIEDVFVERRMTEAFRGSGRNLESVRKFYLEKMARPKIEAALASGNVEEARGYAMVAAFRAWGGQVSAQDFIKEPKIAELVAPILAKLGEDIVGQISKCNNSFDCLDLAKRVKEKLETPKPPPPPPPPEKGMDEALDAMKGLGELGDSFESDDEEKDDPIDEGTESVEADDSGKTGSDPSDAVDGEVEDDAPAASGGEGTDTDDGEGGEGESGDPDFEMGEETDTESGTADEKADFGDVEGEGAEGEGEDPAETGETGEKTDTDSAETDGAPTGEPDPLAGLMDEERDFDKEMSEALSSEAKKELKEADYAIFSRDWDVVTPAPLSTRPDSAGKLDAMIRDKVGVMQKQLERAIAAKARKTWNPGQDRGRIAPGALFKTAVGDDRVFRKRFETKARNTAVSILVDCSGSMSGSRIHIAGVASFALASVLERLKMEYEVIGFTSGASGEMVELMQEDAKVQGASIYKMNWARMEPLYMPVFKPFGGRLDSPAKSRIAHLTERPGWLSQNIDGECVQLAARRLKQQRAERHVMIVLSDGEPACMLGNGLDAHLIKTVKDITKQGVEVIGIGIQTTAVKRFYPKHIVLNDLESLPTQAMAELTKLLLA